MKFLKSLAVKIIGIILLLLVVYYFAGNFIPVLKFWKKSTISLVDTQVALERVRNVNNLLGAEYFGEVIADLKEVYLGVDSTFEKHFIYYGLDSVLTKYRDYKNTGFNTLNKVDSIYLDVLWEVFEHDDKSVDNKNHGLKYRKKYERVVSGNFWRRETRLAYIGTGWVKAGIKLNELQEDDVLVDADLKSIEINLPGSEIIYADINPWFDYEKEVVGFRIILDNKTTRRVTFNESKAVKALCKIKLKEDALSKGILATSDSSAKHTLVKFFEIMGFEKVDVKFDGS